MTSAQPLHIAVGVIVGTDGRILISQRRADCAYAGQWEFPGGKVEAGEAVQAALRRELEEELGITVSAARRLIRITHHYPDRHVLLDTWRVSAFTGQPYGREGQTVRWLQPPALDTLPMLAANRPIVRAAQLPASYLITPEPQGDMDTYVQEFQCALSAGIRLVRLRANALDDAAYEALARLLLTCCQPHDARLLLDRDAAMLQRVGAHGLHLRASALQSPKPDPVLPRGSGLLLAASCHNAHELCLAQERRADFAVVGPVATTATHPGTAAMGWQGFAQLAEVATLPVYALGGMQRKDLAQAWQHGGQGIAAIRGLWAD